MTETKKKTQTKRLKKEVKTIRKIEHKIQNARPKKKKQPTLKKRVNTSVNSVSAGNAAKVAKQFALPGVYPPPRYVSMYTNEETAVCTPFERPESVFSSQAVMGWQNTSVMITTRDPACATVRLAALGTSVKSTYALQFWDTQQQQNNSTFYWPADTPAGVTQLIYPAYSQKYLSDAQYGNNVMYCGVDEGSPLSWIPITYNSGQISPNLSCTATGLSSGDAFNVFVYRWTPEGPSQVWTVPLTFAVPTSSFGFASANPGLDYYAIAVSGQPATRGPGGPRLGVNIITYGDQWAHNPLPNFVNNTAAATSVRINSFSCLYKNKAAPVNRQGKIVGTQMPAGFFIRDVINQGANMYNNVASYANSAEMSVDKGLFGFIKPTQTVDFDYYNYKDGFVYFNMRRNSDFLVMIANITTTAGQDGLWHLRYAVEYRTTDTWRSTKAPTEDYHAFEEGMLALKKIPQWHENPLHLMEILNRARQVVRAVAGGIVKYGPTAISLAQKVYDGLD